MRKNNLKIPNIISGLIFSVILTFFSFSSGCTGGSPVYQRRDSLFLITDEVDVYYKISNPVEKHFLPYALEEVSGLSFLPNGNLICVEDEGGKVYEYNLKTKHIVNSIRFAGSGDYEGIEVVGDSIYVLRSDGDIFNFSYTEGESSEGNRFKTKLSKENDTEGLGYNPFTGNLLVACKEDGDIKGVNAKGKAIYTFDLRQKKIIRKPFMEISGNDLEKFFETHRQFDYDEERIKFEPSAIAYNPLDNYFYLLASVGKLLVVFDKSGKIMATYSISPKVLNQPEGIAFSENGDMYISSEGEGDRGYILKFLPKRK